MNLSPDTLAALAQWASSHRSVASLWLFGSQARGDARADSDYDLAVELLPKRGTDDWAFTDYFFAYEDWKQDLRTVVGRDVSLVCFRDDLDCKFDPRIVRLWSREQQTSEVR